MALVYIAGLMSALIGIILVFISNVYFLFIIASIFLLLPQLSKYIKEERHQRTQELIDLPNELINATTREAEG